MPVFRIERTRDYTVMSNHHLKNPQLSLKAKGLLSMMLSLPEEWNYSERGLAAICKEGVDAIHSAIKELEKAGYMKRNQLRGKGGRIIDTEYVIYETPHKPDVAPPDTGNPDMGSPDAASPSPDNPGELNIHSEKDILKLVTALIANTKGEGKSGDDFWVKAETLLYTALIGYIHYEAPVEEQNFSTLIEFINAMEVREDDEEFQNPVDIMFEELAKQKPNHFAVRQYAKYKLAAGKTAKSILISCGARLAPFDIQELRDLTAYDELRLDTLGDTETALFIIMSDTDDTFNFLISLCYTQLFNLLCEKADDVYGGRLPVHVRCLIDEAANIGQIPRLEKLVATIRSREISCCLVLQAQSQLKALYKDNADTIIGNMDCSIFLGGKEPTTLKELATALGKETIDTYNTGESRGREVSHSLNYQKLGKELMSVDELAVLDGGKCILQLRGVRPFLSDKYDITKHPNYRFTSDYDERNAFDVQEYLQHRLKLKENEVYNVYYSDLADEES